MNPEAATLPHDVYGLVPYQTPLWIYFVAIAFIAVLLLLGYLLWRWFSRRQKMTKTPAIDHLQVCLREFRALEASEPFKRSEQRQFYFELSLLMRRYLELSFALTATDMTTQELAKVIHTYHVLSEGDRKELLEFLHFADLVKFADHESTLAKAEEWHVRLGKVIDRLETYRLAQVEEGIKRSSKELLHEV